MIRRYFEAAAVGADRHEPPWKRAENVMEKSQRTSFSETPTMPWGGPGYCRVRTTITAGLFIAAAAHRICGKISNPFHRCPNITAKAGENC
jgi:hypothetical protein